MTLADMHLASPATRGLRHIVALNSDRLWFALAVLLSLLASFELVLLLVPSMPPAIDGGIGL